MTFQEAIAILSNYEGDRNEAYSVVARAVCDELGISYRSNEAERLSQWIANGDYSGNETPEAIAEEWREED